MQKFQVYSWMGENPPHPRAVQENDTWTFQLTIEGLMTLAEKHDLMIQHKEGSDVAILWLDKKGGKFRTR